MGDPILSINLDLTGEWRTAVRALNRTRATMTRVTAQALRQEGEYFRTAVVKGLKEQAPGGQRYKPLSPYTIAMRTFMRRRSTKALIERGDLLRSVKVHQIDSNTVFVGIRRGVTNADGRELANIGEINEFGTRKPILIRITPKMAHFLAMAFRKMRIPYKPGHGDGYLHITIPPRPTFGPVFEKLGQDVQKRVMGRMIKLLRGILPPPAAGST